MAQSHSYEEVRSLALRALKEPFSKCDQFAEFTAAIAQLIEKEEGPRSGPNTWSAHGAVNLSHDDAELARQVFWDLFRHGVITLGMNPSNPNWPFFKVTEFGKKVLSNDDTYFIADVSSFQALLLKRVPDFHQTTLMYALEAVQAFYADCLLSSTVMLGVASEHSFELLLSKAMACSKYPGVFKSANSERTISKRFEKFRNILRQKVSADLPPELRENLDVNLDGILTMIRLFRNDAGHPTGRVETREQVFVLLQLFIPYSKTLYDLKNFFK